jgi:hypothetical protein
MFIAAIATATALRVLFIGNSLLTTNDVPATVAHMLESDGSGRHVTYKSFFIGHLEDVPANDRIFIEASSGNWDVVVLQAAMVSSSLSRQYPQTRGIALAQVAKAKKARVLLYVEWPRRGIDETEFTMNVYKGLARDAGGCEIIPVCYVWNAVHAKSPSTGIWSADGNHATSNGSYIAAACTYYQIAGRNRTPTFVPNGVDPSFASFALAEAKRIETADHAP